MSLAKIQNLLESLTRLHHQFETQQYNLSELDKQSIKNLIEQINIELITDTHTPLRAEQKPVDVAFQPTPLPKPTVLTTTTENNTTTFVTDVNEELDNLFTPQQEISQPVEVTTPTFQLGLNERIMFAKELYNDNVSALQESLRKLQSFSSKSAAENYFDEQVATTLLQEGKEEEIIQEFRLMIGRMF